MLPAQQQPAPVFRARVDLVTVDVAVVDKDGRPLTAWCQRTSPTSRATGRAGLSRPTSCPSNRTGASRPRPSRACPRPRAIRRPRLAGVSSSSSTSSTLRRAAAAACSSQLGNISKSSALTIASGWWCFPFGTPRVDLTTNRQLIKDAAAKIAGVSSRNAGRQHDRWRSRRRRADGQPCARRLPAARQCGDRQLRPADRAPRCRDGDAHRSVGGDVSDEDAAGRQLDHGGRTAQDARFPRFARGDRVRDGVHRWPEEHRPRFPKGS